jgi:hypothetical protein
MTIAAILFATEMENASTKLVFAILFKIILITTIVIVIIIIYSMELGVELFALAAQKDLLEFTATSNVKAEQQILAAATASALTASPETDLARALQILSSGSGPVMRAIAV